MILCKLYKKIVLAKTFAIYAVNFSGMMTKGIEF